MTHPTVQAVIDCRPIDAFIRGHISGACSIPFNECFERMHELPKRDMPLTLYGDEMHLHCAATFLHEKGYHIQHQQVYSDELINRLKLQGNWDTGNSTSRCWRPSELVEVFVEQFASPIKAPQAVGLDIACGAGRDMVYLAINGFTMHGIDYQQEALQRTQRLAKSHQVSVFSYQEDVEKTCKPFEQLHTAGLSGFDLINVGRYLHRPLLAHLSALLNPGGFLLYQTFMQGCEKISRPKNPNYLLREGELKDTFSDLLTLRNDVILLDDGRPLSSFIAQKPFK